MLMFDMIFFLVVLWGVSGWVMGVEVRIEDEGMGMGGMGGMGMGDKGIFVMWYWLWVGLVKFCVILIFLKNIFLYYLIYNN